MTGRSHVERKRSKERGQEFVLFVEDADIGLDSHGELLFIQIVLPT